MNPDFSRQLSEILALPEAAAPPSLLLLRRAHSAGLDPQLLRWSDLTPSPMRHRRLDPSPELKTALDDFRRIAGSC
jgi:hypothetical protein